MEIIKAIHLRLNPKNINVYVSDRRWQKAAILLKAAAFFCEREETNLTDTLLLRHCLWTTEENRKEVIDIVEEEVCNCGFKTELSSEHIAKEKDNLQKEINKELFHTEDVYKTIALDAQEEEYFKFTVGLGYSNPPEEKIEFYVPTKFMKSKKNFHPVDESNNEIKYLTCNFNKQDIISLTTSDNRRVWRKKNNREWEHVSEPLTYKPEIQFPKDSEKNEVSQRIIKGLLEDVIKISDELDSVISEVEKRRDSFRKEIATPFIPKEVLERSALQGIEKQLKRIRAERESCDLLLDMVKNK